MQQVASIGRYVGLSTTSSQQQTNGTSIRLKQFREQHTTVLWHMPVNTDKEIKANRPDIVIKNRQEISASKKLRNDQSTKIWTLKLQKCGE